jgi:hypothetical protein
MVLAAANTRRVVMPVCMMQTRKRRLSRKQVEERRMRGGLMGSEAVFVQCSETRYKSHRLLRSYRRLLRFVSAPL